MPQPPLAVVTLEVSLKPFRDGFDPANVERVCREIFLQWLALTRHAEAVQVLLWAADGSEILEYQGDLDADMEWARYIGNANRLHRHENDPRGEWLLARHHLYTPDPPRLTYRAFAGVVAALRRIGVAMTGKPVRIGATFDPGPEFAKSRFKYEWHNEACLAATMGAGTFACCYARLHADARRYAGFPQGIPEGLPMGTFLGRQARHFLADCGFDYLWLSNGFGFGLETWGITGAVFDGARFHPERRHECGEQILAFWRLLRAELPAIPIETRGTNLLTGTDIGGDGVPLRELYRGGFGFQAPPNSPWAAMDHDFGLELAGWMSKIAELPDDNQALLYRLYLHDPWWLNSPWLDRYGREPHDIWLPWSVGRLTPAGRVQVPDRIAFLTIDDSLGDMPVQVPNEVIPHLLESRRTAPDEAGPLVWVHPFDEYHDRAFGAAAAVAPPFVHDWLVRGAVNEGLPLNTVLSTRSLAAMQAGGSLAALAGRILVTPVPEPGDLLERFLPEWVAAGGKALLYGSTASASADLRRFLGLAAAEPLSGEGEVVLAIADDTCAVPAPYRVNHRELINGGGCGEVAAGASVLASFLQGQERRAIATLNRHRDWRGGEVAWLRGTTGAACTGERLPTPDPLAERFPCERLFRLVLARFGWSIRAHRQQPAQGGPVVTIHRSGNGWWFAGLNRSTTVPLALRAPDGAPLLLGHDAWLADGHARYHLPRAWKRECRVFVDQAQGGEVRCVEGTHDVIGMRRRFIVHGLQDATVTIYPEDGRPTTLLRDPGWPFVTGHAVEHRVEDGGRRIVCTHVSGTLFATW